MELQLYGFEFGAQPDNFNMLFVNYFFSFAQLICLHAEMLQILISRVKFEFDLLIRCVLIVIYPP